MTEHTVVEGYVPGVVGRLTALHATYYGDRWGLGRRFECEIAEGVAEFVGRYDPATDGLWTVVDADGYVRGGIVIDGRAAGRPSAEDGVETGAQLRYFILDPDLHGEGLGRALLDAAMAFCDERGFDRVFLWTVDELEAAIGLYREHGFSATDTVEVQTDWATDVPYRLFER